MEAAVIGVTSSMLEDDIEAGPEKSRSNNHRKTSTESKISKIQKNISNIKDNQKNIVLVLLFLLVTSDLILKIFQK